MDTNTPQWQPQGTIGGVVDQNTTRDQKKLARPEQGVNCPRCNSTNTKFCYYNNYSLSQPRYFCKTCRRYWTEGGTLRNVPVGGGSRRKHKPPSSSSSSYNNNIPSKKLLDLTPPPHQNPKFSTPQIYNGIPTSSSSSFHFQNPSNFSFMDLLKTTTTTPTSSLFDHSSSNFPLNNIPNVHEINKATSFNFSSLDHADEINPYGSLQLQSTLQDHTIGTTQFPFEQVSKPEFELDRSGLQIDSNGNWLPGASW